MINILEEPTGDTYKTLLSYASTQCNVFILVVRPDMKLSQSGQTVLDSLKPYLIKKIESKEWPGTIIYSTIPALIYYYTINEASIKIIQNAVNRLFSWIQPSYPEDLCFLKDDSTPWLVTITHEKDAYIETNIEPVTISKAVSGLRITK